MTSQLYDIFRKDNGGVPIWVEAVENLDAAKRRIIHLAARRPGQYMIFSQRTGQMVSTFTAVASPAARNEHRTDNARFEESFSPHSSRSETVF